MKQYFYALIASMIIISSCTKSNMAEPAENLLKVAEAYAPGAAAKVELYSSSPLATGYNTIYVALYDSATGQRIDYAGIELVPEMDMGNMMHSCPVREPFTSCNKQIVPGRHCLYHAFRQHGILGGESNSGSCGQNRYSGIAR